MNPKFIYFDLDDTLLDHRGAEKAALKELYHQFDLFDITSVEHLIDTYHRINTGLWDKYSKGHINRQTLQRLRFENTLKKLGLDSSRYEETGTYYMKAYRDHWQWVRGAEKAFREISDHFDVGILTNGFAETQKEKIRRFSLADTVQHIVISEETGFLKPQPEIFEHATSLTRQKPEEILYIGDSYTSDVIGGGAFGWNVAWFTSNTSIDEDKQSDAQFVFNDFNDLTAFLEI